MNNTPMTRLENMTQFLLEYGVNPKKEPINTVLFHLKAAESELTNARELAGPISLDLIFKLKSERDEARAQRDTLAEALRPFIDGWSDKSCDSIVTEQQFRDAKQALAAVKGEKP
jgi:hypothetical protein